MCRRAIVLLSLALTGCSTSETPRTVSSTPQQATSPQVNAVASNAASQPDPAGSDPIATKTKIDACALLTTKEIESVQGETLKETKPNGKSGGGFTVSQCFFTLPTFANSINLLVAQRDDSVESRDPRDFWKDTFHREKKSERESDKNRAKEKSRERGQEEAAAPPQKVAGVGDEAFWTGGHVDGALYALKGNTYIRVSIGGAVNRAAKIRKLKVLAQAILKRL